MRAESSKLLMHVHRRENTSTQTGLTPLFQHVVEHENITQCITPHPPASHNLQTHHFQNKLPNLTADSIRPGVSSESDSVLLISA